MSSSEENRVLDALNFVSTISYSIANNENNKPKERIDAALVFLKSEAWLATSKQQPLALEDLQKAIELK